MNQVSYTIALGTVCFFSFGSPAQESKNPDFDTAYVRDLSELLAVRIYGINKFSKFSIRDNTLGHELKYAPNQNLNLGFGINYRWFGLGLAFNFPFINNDNNKYGNTQRLDFQLNIFSRKFLIDTYLQVYQGFYIENPGSYLSAWSDSSDYPQRPDIRSRAFTGSFIYIINNKRYSARAAFVQNEVQLKSAGSWLAGGYFSFYNLEGDSNLVPPELRIKYNPDLLWENLRTSTLGIAFGYSHNFVMWKKLNLSLTLVPGLAFVNYHVDYAVRDPFKKTRLAGRVLGRVALVYNTERAFTGITASNDNFGGTLDPEGKYSLNVQVGVVRIFYGRRFGINRKR